MKIEHKTNVLTLPNSGDLSVVMTIPEDFRMDPEGIPVSGGGFHGYVEKEFSNNEHIHRYHLVRGNEYLYVLAGWPADNIKAGNEVDEVVRAIVNSATMDRAKGQLSPEP